MTIIVHLLLSVIPSLISIKVYQLHIKITRMCSLFNDLNSLEVTGSIVFILCLVIILSITLVVVFSLTYKTIHDSQMAVTKMGGLINSGKGKGLKLILKCIFQPITSAVLQIAATSILALTGQSIEDNRESIVGCMILIPNTAVLPIDMP